MLAEPSSGGYPGDQNEVAAASQVTGGDAGRSVMRGNL